MTPLTWSHDDDAWIGQVTSEELGDIEIRVATEGELDSPTDAQRKSVAMVEELATKGLPRLNDLARKYATEYLVEDMEDEGFEIELYAAVIPKLRDAVDPYIVFVGHSEIDIEHGVAVVCKNGSKFVVTHSDVAYSAYAYDWDDTAELDQLIGG